MAQPPGRPGPLGVPSLERRWSVAQRLIRENGVTYNVYGDPRATTLSTPLDQVLRQRRGVCQDFAHLQIGCLRSLGLSPRYVNGYLLSRPLGSQKPGSHGNGHVGRNRESGGHVGADASHAWVGVYLPGHGWIDADPTNRKLVRDEHVTVAWGRDYGDVSSIKGVILGGGEHRMTVAVRVTPLQSAGA